MGAIETRAGSFDRVFRERKISHDVTARTFELALGRLVDRRTARDHVRSTLEKVLDLVRFGCRCFAKRPSAASERQVKERRWLRHSGLLEISDAGKISGLLGLCAGQWRDRRTCGSIGAHIFLPGSL
ncbi:hypothetical protein ABIF65_003287 [Bradyrhizobium japonicum]|uniref:hypothetical protein n=1 Tax=Bradyrhizobium liaoningense TaxID=43992 RepID=UPI001BA5EDC3|nr:hypothetical protein [Bradyrhizobium liaoningense]MBR0945552.1 hypothetical protein [Bradyrhizobium liaoningense]MBR1032267.1 hypothetical protein [Bradyrhizobium liaoningense]MBR1070831.1 hypothetical protein [Bradyrhizobium liaoningense]